MCRWFSYISDKEECLLEDVLIRPQHSLSQMCNEHYVPGLIHRDPNNPDQTKRDEAENKSRNLALNVDGLGLAWYTDSQSDFIKECKGRRPAVYKSISPPLNDYNYRNLCANISTKTLFAHVRATSAAAVMQNNCHPFVLGRQVFMHNGTVSHFRDIRRKICDMLDETAYYNIDGSTDTEHVAALYMSILTKGRGPAAWEEEYSAKDMAKALRETVARIIKVQKETLGDEATPNSLNLAVTDGDRLVTFRFRNHRTEQPPSLYWSTTAGVTLNRKYPKNPDGSVNITSHKKPSEHGKHLIVASEPTTRHESEWKLIDKNHCVMYENGHTTIEKIPYDDSWNVQDTVEYSAASKKESVTTTIREIDDDDSWDFENSDEALAKSAACKCVVS